MFTNINIIDSPLVTSVVEIDDQKYMKLLISYILFLNSLIKNTWAGYNILFVVSYAFQRIAYYLAVLVRLS